MTQPRPLAVHEPRRPSWDCAGCDAPWPCECARAALLIEYADDPVALGVHLCRMMHRAVGDFVAHGWPTTPYEVHARFLAWADDLALCADPAPRPDTAARPDEALPSAPALPPQARPDEAATT